MLNDFQNLEDTIGKFSTISLEEMDNVKLMSRMDTKYVFHAERIPGLLEMASDHYRVLSIDDHRIFTYNSLYFDTVGLRSYLDHHNGVRPRYKVRFREYQETGGIYLEVKRKIANDRTRKCRTRVESIEKDLSEKSVEFISKHSPFDASQLIPSLWTIFRRITLVGKSAPERITIDTDLSFHHKEKESALPFLCICEVKREQTGGKTDFMRILKENRIYPGSSSKYCLGTILLKKEIKQNQFKRLILYINKLENASRLSISPGQPA